MAMKDLKELGMTEISLNQLDGVVGGVITESQKVTLNGVLKQAKGAGMSMDAVLGMIPGYFNMLHATYPDVTLEEVQAYITDMWESI